MSKSLFDSLNHFIRRWYKWVIAAWVVAVLLSLLLIPSFFSAVSYDITGGFGGPSNTMSTKTANIIQAEFPNLQGNDNNIIIVLQNASVYSQALKQVILNLNATLYKDLNVGNYTGEQSVYWLEATLLNESLPAMINQAALLQPNIATINSGLYSLQDNLSSLSAGLFQLQDGVNQTAQLIFGVPATFVEVWNQTLAQTDLNMANSVANATVYALTDGFGGDAESIQYYSAFDGYWMASFQALPKFLGK